MIKFDKQRLYNRIYDVHQFISLFKNWNDEKLFREFCLHLDKVIEEEIIQFTKNLKELDNIKRYKY